MKETLVWIGSFVLSAILIAIPILLTCSVIMEWESFIQWILTIASMFEFIMLILTLQYFTIENKEEKWNS